MTVKSPKIFPQTDIAIGQTNLQTTLDLAYYPNERGPYNNNPNFNTQLPEDNFGGIIRPVTTTNFEQANVEFIQFWVLDPTFREDGTRDNSISGELVFNIGNIYKRNNSTFFISRSLCEFRRF